MFNTSYKFTFLYKTRQEGEPYNVQHRFSFRCKKNQRHFVLLDEFDFDFFGVKFYPAHLEQSTKKYQVLMGNNDAQVKINTCLNIMASLLNKTPTASFGFTGARSEGEDATKPSKRFKLYRRIMQVFFSPVNFAHYELPESNAYFLINRKAGDPEELLNKITEMIRTQYEF